MIFFHAASQKRISQVQNIPLLIKHAHRIFGGVEMITDDPMLNCTSPEQIKGQILNDMEIEKFPPEGKECKAPSSVWGNSPIRVNRKRNIFNHKNCYFAL